MSFTIEDTASISKLALKPHKKVANGWNFTCNDSAPGLGSNYVAVKFPSMHIPFSSCEPYKNSKSTLRTLTVDFKDTDESNDRLDDFRNLLEELYDRITALCTEVNEGRPAKVAPLIKASKNIEYHDLVSLRFWPGTADFRHEATKKRVKEQSVDLRGFRAEPTVVLKDVWLRDGVYYPRLFVTSCILIDKRRE